MKIKMRLVKRLVLFVRVIVGINNEFYRKLINFEVCRGFLIVGLGKSWE